MIVLSKGVLPPRKSIDRHVVQNGRLRTLNTKNLWVIQKFKLNHVILN